MKDVEKLQEGDWVKCVSNEYHYTRKEIEIGEVLQIERKAFIGTDGVGWHKGNTNHSEISLKFGYDKAFSHPADMFVPATPKEVEKAKLVKVLS